MGGYLVNTSVDMMQNRAGVGVNISVGEPSVAREANKFQSVFRNSCCSEESASSSQTLTVLTVGFTRLMMGVYLGSRNRDR